MTQPQNLAPVISPSIPPNIPDDAPFTPGQRAWLNGFLAGLYSPAPPAKRVAVLYGSQTGTAESLARKMSKVLKVGGYTVSLQSLQGYEPAALAGESCALFIVSTHGDGEAPEAAQPFFRRLCPPNHEPRPHIGKLAYSVLALGDSQYERFCNFGRELDRRLEELGATRIAPRVDSDVEVEAPYAAWKAAVLAQLGAGPAATPAAPAVINSPAASEPRMVTPRYTRDRPYPASLIEKRALTHPASSKLTLHLEFSIDDAGMRYEAGDACGVVPRNAPALVDAVLRQLAFNGSEVVDVPKAGAVTLREALLHRFAVGRLTRPMVSSYAALTGCAPLAAMVAPELQAEFEAYLRGRDLLDLLREWPCGLAGAGDVLKCLPPLAPRLYSIASSPLAHPNRVQLTVAVVRYRVHDRERGGVCSTLLADRTEVGERLPLFIQPNRKFRLPEDSAAPVIMIGPGTGVAPFRAFLHQRRALGATGRNWLFFGERQAAADFLYRDELQALHADGHLTRLDTAFSRDQGHKIYVQDLMRRHARQLWEWLQDGAYVYVCGDAERMAKDVNRALHHIVETEGGLTPEAAADYIEMLTSSRRYQRDVY